MRYRLSSNGHDLDLQIRRQQDHSILSTEHDDYEFEAVQVRPGVYSILLRDRSFLVGISDAGEGLVSVDGRPLQILLLDEIQLKLKEFGWNHGGTEDAGVVNAQIPGLITQIFHQVGEEVQKGDALFLMEAMKMENEIKAPVGGRIRKIHVEAGQTVEKGAVIIEIGTE